MLTHLPIISDKKFLMKIKLLMLPFSGGAAHVFNPFFDFAPSWLTLIPTDLPGHGRRFSEPLLTDIHAIVDDLFLQLSHEMTEPYAVYGHSFGAVLAYLLCRKTIAQGLPVPLHLFVSGRRSPTCSNDEVLHTLPAREFLQGVLSYGGISQEILKEPELIKMLLPVLRADFTAVENYIYRPEPPLQIPVTAMGGTEDHKVPFEQIIRWQDITAHRLRAEKCVGGHFFPFLDPKKIMELVHDILCQVPQISFSRPTSPVFFSKKTATKGC
ncbi:hypothetical protein GKODMF_06220 [Candidatus Electrothrix gigas]